MKPSNAFRLALLLSGPNTVAGSTKVASKTIATQGKHIRGRDDWQTVSGDEWERIEVVERGAG